MILNFPYTFIGMLLVTMIIAPGCDGIKHTITNLIDNKAEQQALLGYDLAARIIPAKNSYAGVMICLHGYGANNSIINTVRYTQAVTDHIISFNFPDHDIHLDADHQKSSFGSIQEVLPVLYLLKKCVVDAHMQAVSLYGFSAGGAAAINTLAVLVGNTYDTELKKLGVTQEIKKQIINALEKGIILLDCPLKSMDEIVDFRGNCPAFDLLARRYRDNGMRPIDSLRLLKDLKLTIILNFQVPDEILSNRDDQVFITRMQELKNAHIHVVLSHDRGHNDYHSMLWKRYADIK